MNQRVRAALNSIISIVLALLLAFLVIGILLVWQNYNPAETFLALFQGAFIGKSNLSASIVLAIPLVLGGLGIALSFRCGIFNIGGEGQLYLGAFAATWLGVNLTGLPFWLHIPVCLLGSALFGGLWALIPGYLKIRRGYNEVITSVLLNYVGVYFVNYTLASFFKAEGALNHQSPKIQESAMLSKLMTGSELNTSLFLTLAIVALFYFIFYKTDVGFKLRAVGANGEAARTSGVNTRKYLLIAIITSGALAGMAGSVQILGYQHVMVQNFSPNTGYDIISVALMGNLHPIGVLLAGFLLGALRSGASVMQIMIGVPVTILYIIQGIVILSVLGFSYAKIDFIGLFIGRSGQPKKEAV
ncbi:MAG: ABC transporter permease [Oscillospiraceae bacterium]|nr:ABC transporter permease [Oscillospiraceae bacterium]